MDTLTLEPHAVRVLGALIEKQALTPDSYPLTLNALLSACNQLTSREPVMQLSEADLSATLDSLLAAKLINERLPAGSRVAKYEHRLNYAWNIDGARLAALALLMLRGAQTAAELRTRAGRLYSFGSVEEVETALNALADKYPPLVLKLARQPGEREARWVHTLHPMTQPAATTAPASGDDSLAERVSALEQTVASLLQRVTELEGGAGQA
ncbi:YceH family protein [Vogesella sp. LYT5W]|uniref:YceH family protein n=1 Tax=Vogesella margarita TaxID=2984199 RepID=A0ABT5IM24_9NEIS|nr:YceH family protein [Vogesella margarita]MDC7713360.1 YceH family protein [Vogesella margarita]